MKKLFTFIVAMMATVAVNADSVIAGPKITAPKELAGWYVACYITATSIEDLKSQIDQYSVWDNLTANDWTDDDQECLEEGCYWQDSFGGYRPYGTVSSDGTFKGGIFARDYYCSFFFVNNARLVKGAKWKMYVANTKGECTLTSADLYLQGTLGAGLTPTTTAVTLDEDAKTYPTDGVWDESKTYDITLKRTMKADQWNTLMLSFPMTAAEVKSNFGNDVTVMKMTGIENNVVNFETVDLTTDDATAIDVCEPYIVKPTSAIEQIKVTGKTGLKNSLSGEEYNLGLQWGFGQRKFDNDKWCINSSFRKVTESGEGEDEGYPTYVLSNDKFFTVNSEVEVKGYRWVIYDWTDVEEARTLTLSLDGQTTGIDAMSNVQCAMSNGKFIQDGRMVIVNNGKKFNTAGQNIK